MPQSITDTVVEILQTKFPDALVDTWVQNVDYRRFPFFNVRRIGGPRHPRRPRQLSFPVIELTLIGNQDLDSTYDLYDDAVLALYDAVKRQTQTAHGYLHSMEETMGATEFDSPYTDTWRVQGLIKFGLRPLRN